VNASAFELNVSLPADARFAETMRDLAAHAARYAGCANEEADRYGDAVMAIVLGCLDQTPSDDSIPVILRRGNGPVEFLIGCGTQFEADISPGGPITIGWTREDGPLLCRVALDL
jgi:hypothetical protein